jgi:hypothetical protein
MEHDTPTAPDPACACAHPVVRRLTEKQGVYFVDVWKCDLCDRRYTLLPEHPGGNLTLMEPQLTLRDQFAMAALNGIIQLPCRPDMVDMSPEETRANITRWTYEWADSMLEARK